MTGKKDISAPPMMLHIRQQLDKDIYEITYAGIIQMMIQSHRFDCLRMPDPTRSVKKMLTTPDGMFIKAACLGL